MSVPIQRKLVCRPQSNFLFLIVLAFVLLSAHSEWRKIAPDPEHVLFVLEAIHDVFFRNVFTLSVTLTLLLLDGAVARLPVQGIIGVVKLRFLHVHILRFQFIQFPTVI